MTNIDSLASIFPAERFVRDDAFRAAFESDGLTAFRAKPLGVVIPETADEVVSAVRWCHEQGVPFVARGSGTSLSGGSLPVADGIVIALNRLNRILHLDPQNRIAVVEPGVVNQHVSDAAAPHGLYYAPDPSSQSICTIGGKRCLQFWWCSLLEVRDDVESCRWMQSDPRHGGNRFFRRANG